LGKGRFNKDGEDRREYNNMLMEKHKLISDMRNECECENNKYCPLEILIKANTRIFEQHKLVERFKILKSESLKRELDWDEAYKFWVSEGYAKRFSEIYKDNYTYKELKDRMEVYA